MLLSDIFSIPFLICLAICILLIGCSSIYFYQRILQQDHKITSMVSLISSLTEEDPSKPSINTFPTPIAHLTPSLFSSTSLPSNNIIIDIKPDDIKQPIDNRIQVSDDDESDMETESSDSEYSTTSSENNECEILSEIEELNDILDLEENNYLEDSCVVDEKEKEEEEAITDDIDIDIDITTTKSIHLEQPTDFSIFKSINVIDIIAVEPDDATNYKKMTLSKLRETAQSQGHGDTSKLKKQELLKLLGVE
jgi:hypothetical protein